jgi:hypothetical protein
MPQVSNRFFVTAIQDGQVASGYLRADRSLQQFYDRDTATCAPDWSVVMSGGSDVGVHPLITAYTRLGGTIQAPQTNKWYWNGQEIQFSGNNSTNFTYAKGGTTYPLFIKGTNAQGLPTLKINGNLAGWNASDPHTVNIDQDIISNQGTMEAGGDSLAYSMDIVVRLSQLVATNGYWGDISYDGNSVITSPDITSAEGKVKLLPSLYLGTTAQAAADFSVKWYIEGVSDYSGYSNPSRFATKKSGTQDAMSLTLTADDVVDNVTVRCDFYDASDNLKCSAYIEVDDAQDDDEMQITHPGGQSSANLRKDESVTFTVWMSSRTDVTQIKNAYTHFKLKLLSSTGATITSQIGTPDSDGYLDITQSNVTVIGTTVAAKAGRVTIPFSVAHNNGDSISGVIVAY